MPHQFAVNPFTSQKFPELRRGTRSHRRAVRELFPDVPIKLLTMSNRKEKICLEYAECNLFPGAVTRAYNRHVAERFA